MRYIKARPCNFPFCDAVQEMNAGLFEADFGVGLLKKRIARPGKLKAASVVGDIKPFANFISREMRADFNASNSV